MRTSNNTYNYNSILNNSTYSNTHKNSPKGKIHKSSTSTVNNVINSYGPKLTLMSRSRNKGDSSYVYS